MGVICKILILRGVWSIFRGEECSRIWRFFGKVQERPRMAGRKTQAWRDPVFQNFHHEEMGW